MGTSSEGDALGYYGKRLSAGMHHQVAGKCWKVLNGRIAKKAANSNKFPDTLRLFRGAIVKWSKERRDPSCYLRP
jgi:hypothetical protein